MLVSFVVDESRVRRVLALAVLPISVLAASALVWRSSEALYSDRSTTAPDTFTSISSVDVTADREGQTVFGTSTGLSPDDNLTALTLPAVAGPYVATTTANGGSRCVLVSYTGATANIRMYAAVSGVLAPYMLFTVDSGSSATGNDCTGFTSGTTLYGASPNSTAKVNGLPGDWAGAAGNEWSAVGTGSSRWYRLSWLLPKGISTASEGQTATATFTWEARNQ